VDYVSGKQASLSKALSEQPRKHRIFHSKR
jgi:hypothetical protein